MKNKAIIITVIIGILFLYTSCLTGCRDSHSKGIDEAKLADAKSVYDVAPLMTMSEDRLIYSECRHDKDLHFYFDILGNDQYIKVNYDGKDYVLLYYDFSSYDLVATKIKSANKIYSGQSLDVEIEIKIKDSLSIGCFPNSSKCRLILELDKDVSSVYVMGRPFTEYSGGRVFVCGKEGIVDKDLQFLVPPIYDGIYDLQTFEDSNCPMYYRVYKDGHNGVLDNHYNPVLSTSYGNIYYINENKFIVSTDFSDVDLDEIYIVDGNENIIKKTKGFLCPDNDSRFYCADGQIKISDSSYGDMWGYGVMDQELNIIIEPVYESVYWLDNHYLIEDYDSNELYFDINGNEE